MSAIERTPLAIVSSYDPAGVGGVEKSLAKVKGRLEGTYTLYRPGAPADTDTTSDEVPYQSLRVPGYPYTLPRNPRERTSELTDYDYRLFYDPMPPATSISHTLPPAQREASAMVWHGEIHRKRETFGGWGTYLANKATFLPLQKRAAKEIGLHMTVTDIIADELREWKDDINVVTVPPVVGGPFRPELRNSDEFEDRRREHLKEGEFGILIASRLHPYKGLHVLPDVVAGLRREFAQILPTTQYEGVSIKLCGRKEDAAYANNLLAALDEADRRTASEPHADRVRFEYYGVPDHDELYELYSTHDVLFHPSTTEGFGMVVVEAMKCGSVPIIHERCKATREVISGAENEVGVMIPDAEGAVDAIASLMQKPDSMRTLSKNGIEYANNVFTAEQTLDKLEMAIKTHAASLS